MGLVLYLGDKLASFHSGSEVSSGSGSDSGGNSFELSDHTQE